MGVNFSSMISEIADAQNEKFSEILGVATVMAGAGSTVGIRELAKMGALIDDESIKQMLETDAEGDDVFADIEGFQKLVASGDVKYAKYDADTKTLIYSRSEDGSSPIYIDLSKLSENFEVTLPDNALAGIGSDVTIDANHPIPSGLTWTASSATTLTAKDDKTGITYTVTVASGKFTTGETYKNESQITNEKQAGVTFTDLNTKDQTNTTATVTLETASGVNEDYVLTMDEIEAIDVKLTDSDGLMQNPGTLYQISTWLQQLNQGVSAFGATGKTAGDVLKEAVQTYQRGLSQ